MVLIAPCWHNPNTCTTAPRALLFSHPGSDCWHVGMHFVLVQHDGEGLLALYLI